MLSKKIIIQSHLQETKYISTLDKIKVMIEYFLQVLCTFYQLKQDANNEN